jgi:hypothetical protein
MFVDVRPRLQPAREQRGCAGGCEGLPRVNGSARLSLQQSVRTAAEGQIDIPAEERGIPAHHEGDDD